MPRTEMAIRTITRSGIVPTAGAAGDVTNGNVVLNNNGLIWLEIENTSATVASTLTIVTPDTVDGNAIADKVYNLPVSSKLRVGALSPTVYGTNLELNVGHTTVTVAAYQLAPL